MERWFHIQVVGCFIMAMTLISHQTLTGSVASVTLGSGGTIPQTYKTLKLVMSVRTDRASQYADIAGIRFNNNTNNYSARTVYGDSSFAQSSTVASGSYTWGWFAYASASLVNANTFASSEITIPNYSGSTNKFISNDSVIENNSSTQNQAFQTLIAGLWSDTSAITSIVLVPGFGTNFVTGSTFTLYGIS